MRESSFYITNEGSTTNKKVRETHFELGDLGLEDGRYSYSRSNNSHIGDEYNKEIFHDGVSSNQSCIEFTLHNTISKRPPPLMGKPNFFVALLASR